MSEKRTRKNHLSKEMVRLHFIDAFDLDPPAEKTLTKGRFFEALEAAGCPGNIVVRSRMITAISETHFFTTSGKPVTLISLHGKDDVLVLGPAWAIERLAAGEQPEETHEAKIKNTISNAEREILHLSELPDLLHSSLNDTEVLDEKNRLEWFFRTNFENIKKYFELHDVSKFVEKHLSEVKAYHRELGQRLCKKDKYPYWWAEWEELPELDILPSGRHISSYPVSPHDKGDKPRKSEHPQSDGNG